MNELRNLERYAEHLHSQAFSVFPCGLNTWTKEDHLKELTWTQRRYTGETTASTKEPQTLQKLALSRSS